MQYRGSCHCGKVAYEVEGDIQEAYSCNCSMCERRGSLLWFAPREKFKLLRGEPDLTTYTFNKHQIRHRFCKSCGTQPFGEGEQGGQQMRAVNLRCVPEIDLEALAIQKVDGASF